MVFCLSENTMSLFGRRLLYAICLLLLLSFPSTVSGRSNSYTAYTVCVTLCMAAAGGSGAAASLFAGPWTAIPLKFAMEKAWELCDSKCS